MSNLHNPFDTLQRFQSGSGEGVIYSLPALRGAGFNGIDRLPVSIRIVLESVLRNCDGELIREDDVAALANWNAGEPESREIPFVVARIVLQDFTGVPLVVDLAAMRDAVNAVGADPSLIEPLVPVDLVVDHSVQVDRSGTPDAFLQNLATEFERNRERYAFLKWGQQAFAGFRVVPPSIGIVHQVNLEYLARVVFDTEVNGTRVFYPDTVVGTDSHTTMINGLGVVGWGVGGIEAEAGMLGQPVYFLTPEVIGVHLGGHLREGVTATDLTLRVTEMLREEDVVGKFVEFHGEGAENLTVADRATVSNMAPEYGATIGFFPVDEKTMEYLKMTGRSEEQVQQVYDYFRFQELFGIPRRGAIDFTKVVDLDLTTIEPSVAGPKRPQDRVRVSDLKSSFQRLLTKSVDGGGYGLTASQLQISASVGENGSREAAGEEPRCPPADEAKIGHGSVLIAAITSCTNTSNPIVMLGAGLLAKKAVERGLTVGSTVKTSLAPGSRVVTDYLRSTDLQRYLDALGFNLVGYGCTTCIGNSGPLDDRIEEAIAEAGLVAASVLSGNRNFEARIHSSIKANYLMSPPLVVAYALAGRVDIDLETEPLGTGGDGNPVFLRDIWPTQKEILVKLTGGIKPSMYRENYADILDSSPEWLEVATGTGTLYPWDENSTYIRRPPFFNEFGMSPQSITEFHHMRALAVVADSVTTDHISPAGAIPPDGPAGKYLLSRGVKRSEFNSFGSRRGNDQVMTRGTFANIRFKNLLADGREGGWTQLMPEGELMPIFDACLRYAERQTPLIVFAGDDYGMGSSRDWAAKGASLLGVKAVVASSFERIHRSNLIGMGVLPFQFHKGQSHRSLRIDGSEEFSLLGLDDSLRPMQEVVMEIRRASGAKERVNVIARIDTPIEVEYYRHGGILPYVLRTLLQAG